MTMINRQNLLKTLGVSGVGLCFPLILFIILSLTDTAFAINPYMPLWEHIPDGEPHVFGNRVYVYGSHETLPSMDCGPDYKVWSAPLDDLTNWTDHGVCFDGGQGSGYLLAPDVVQGLDGKYYMYAYGRCKQAGNTADEGTRANFHGLVMVSDRPEGPFEYIGDMMKDGKPFRIFDPAVIVDNGRVYLFGGSAQLYELDPTDMRTIIDGPYTVADEKGERIPYFFEGASIRKINDTYVFIYAAKHDTSSKWVTTVAHAANGYTGTLEYATAKSIYGPYTYGGVLIDIGGDVIGTSSAGQMQRSNYNGNTHGSLFEAEGQWYICYHRQTSDNQRRRQACMDPIDLQIVDGNVVISQAERTMNGAELNGVNALQKLPAAYADYLTNEAFIDSNDVTPYNENSRIVDVTNSVVIGYRYLNFEAGDYNVSVDVLPLGVPGVITVELDDPGSKPIARLEIPANGNGVVTLDKVACGHIEGKHGVYFNFYAISEANICEFNAFEFSK